MGLGPDDLRSRLQLDWNVAKRMYGDAAEAYRTTADMEVRRNPVTLPGEAGQALRYRVAFPVRTLVGAGQFQDETVVGFDLGVGDYPHAEPLSWAIGPRVPWSPHFKSGSPVCTGGFWQAGGGRTLLGQLFVHVARLLNWDERMADGYEGWNGDAIRYWRTHFGGRPLNPGLRYPTVPTDLVHGLPPSGSLFTPGSAPMQPVHVTSALFTRAEGDR